MKYRSREKILYEILKALSIDKTRLSTHIMYDCRLSYAQIHEYIMYMEQNKLLRRVGTILSITEEGRDLLKSLDKVFSIKLTLT